MGTTPPRPRRQPSHIDRFKRRTLGHAQRNVFGADDMDIWKMETSDLTGYVAAFGAAGIAVGLGGGLGGGGLNGVML